MNERIKTLAALATTEHTSYFDGRGNVTETYFDKERFAELIVRECIEIVEYKGRKVGAEHPVGFNLMDAAWDIRESFGVEE